MQLISRPLTREGASVAREKGSNDPDDGRPSGLPRESLMAADRPLNELITRWHQLRQQGQSLSLQQLCADCPERLEELRQHLEAVRSVESFLGSREAAAGGPSSEARTLELSRGERPAAGDLPPSPATRCWACSAVAPWASFIRPGRSA
jgi:hypothetical protein